MYGLLVPQWGGPEVLTWSELESPTPGPGEVRVDVTAAGVNFADLLLIAGRYQAKPPLPLVPGFELAGVVGAVGEEVETVSRGDRVMAYHQGAFAEQVVIPAPLAVRVPEGLDDETAATTPVAFGTADHALFGRAEVGSGDVVVVLGASGGVGSAAVQLAAAAGARVAAVASTPEKREWVERLGAEWVWDADPDALRSRIDDVSSGRGADVVFDPVGGEWTELAFRSLAWGGRHLIVGFAAGDIPRLPANLPLLKGAALVGVFWGDYCDRFPHDAAAMLASIADRLAAGELKGLVTEVYAAKDAEQALSRLAQRTAMGRIALRF